MLFGKLVPSRTPYVLSADAKLSSTYYIGELGYLTKLTCYIDGLGSADMQQVAQAFVYDTEADKLLGVSEEIEVPRFQGPAWVDFYFDPKKPPLIDHGAMYDVGLIGGPASGLIRIYGDDPSLRGGRTAADFYTDGPSATFGAAVSYTHDLSIYGTGFQAWPLPVETDFWYARLPFTEAQAKLSETGVLPRTAVTCSAGWHGTTYDGELGSFVIVNKHSDIADRLGERVKITRYYKGRPLSVYAYCHGWATMGEDISLTRELFVRLAPLADNYAVVHVETMGPNFRG
jgi:hypothetical protein